MSKEKADKNIHEALNYLRLDFRNLGELLGLYHPLEVLKLAAWEERRIVRTRSRDPLASASGRLLPVLLQSIIQSTYFKVENGISSNRNIREKDWHRILGLVDDVSKRLLRFIECYTVSVVRSCFIAEEDAELYRDTLFDEVFPPVEDDERIRKLSYLLYGVLEASEGVSEKRFGVPAEALVHGIYSIARRGVNGIDKLTDDIAIYKAEMETKMAEKRAMDPSRSISDDAMRDEIVKENGWRERVERMAGERDGYDLYRPDFASDLPSASYEAMSAYPGTIDLDQMLLRGLFPATVYPFLHFGDMYFSFAASHIPTYTLRMLQELAGLTLCYTAAADAACLMLFRETDEDEVYSFDGNKIDVSVLSSLTEVNAFITPALFQARLRRRDEERARKPRTGHKGLILDPDTFSELEEAGDGIYSSSLYALIKSAEDAGSRRAFLRTNFGQLEMPVKSEFDEIIDPEDETPAEINDDDIPDGTTDEYEYDPLDDDEKEREIEEKEKALEEDIPPEYPDYGRSAEIEKLCDKYALTPEIIEKDAEIESEMDEYERELDDDDYIDEDYAPDDDPGYDEPRSEDEELYEEAEKEDEYEDDSDDPDQLTFLDELFSDKDDEEGDKLQEEDFVEEEEEEFEDEEKEAEAFAVSSREHIHVPSVYAASEEDETDDASDDRSDAAFPAHDEPVHGSEADDDTADRIALDAQDPGVPADDEDIVTDGSGQSAAAVPAEDDGPAAISLMVQEEAGGALDDSSPESEADHKNEEPDAAPCAYPLPDGRLPEESCADAEEAALVAASEEGEAGESTEPGDEDIQASAIAPEASAEAASSSDVQDDHPAEDDTAGICTASYDASHLPEAEAEAVDEASPEEPFDAGSKAEAIAEEPDSREAEAPEEDAGAVRLPESAGIPAGETEPDAVPPADTTGDLFSMLDEDGEEPSPSVPDEGDDEASIMGGAAAGEELPAEGNLPVHAESAEPIPSPEPEAAAEAAGVEQDEEERETAESLIEKGIVRPVELAGGEKVFVMSNSSEPFPEMIEEDEDEPVIPELDGILGEISRRMDPSGAFMSFVSSADGEMLDYLGRVIRSSWERQRADGKDKMFSIYDYSISVLIAADKVNDDLRKEELLNNAGAVMYSRHRKEWNALVLSIDDDFHIADAYERTITPASFSASNWKICTIIGEQLIARGK